MSARGILVGAWTKRVPATLLAASLLWAAPALAQDKAAAEAAAKDIATKAQAMGKAVVADSASPDMVPGYAGTDVPGAELIDDPDNLSSHGSSAAVSSDAYATIVDPTRPVFDPTTIDVSGAQKVEEDPDKFLGTGINVDGTTGSCEPVPEGSAGPSTYFETCNQGDQIIVTPRTCTSSLSVRFERITTWIYYTARTGPYAGRGHFDGAVASGVCKSKGAFSYCANLPLHGYKASQCGKVPTNANPEILECTQEIPGVSGATPELMSPPVLATGQWWASKSETVSPPIVTRNNGACPFETNGQCVEQGGEVCTDSDPVTRVIDGVPVTQPCWAWQRNFQCTERKPGNDCGALEAKPECHFDHNECLSENADGTCNVFDRAFACTTSEAPAETPPASICNGDLYCINGECTKIEREASAEFKDAMVAVQTLGDVRDQFNADDFTLFNGEKAGCHKPVFGLVNCCAGKQFPLAPPFLTTFMCSAEEKLLDEKDRKGLCHYVGSYCSDKILGVCTSKRKSYCCYQSKLARILQEQGRAQIGKPWGKPKTPDCKGFSIEEFQKLDLSKMDFTEVYDEFMDAAKVPDEVQTSIDVQKKIEEYYKLHAGP